MLIQFDRQGTSISQDRLERLGHAIFNAFQIGIDKRYTVELSDQRHIFTHKGVTSTRKIASVVLGILGLPIFAILTLIGVIAYRYSASYQALRKDLDDQSHAAKRIQSMWREKKLREKEQAALVIQRYARGFLARKAFLSRSLYPHYAEECERLTRLGRQRHFTLIPAGASNVYIPKKLEQVVIKSLRGPGNGPRIVQRFATTQMVRGYLRQIRSHHLVIPRIRRYRNYLVEERLPVNHLFYHNIDLYCSNRKAFNEAICEMVRLCKYVTFKDLLAEGQHPFMHVVGESGIVRYDNIPFFLEKGKNGLSVGKIGLVDLEDVSEGSDGDAVVLLTRIFPYHAALIRKEARKQGLKVDRLHQFVAEMIGKRFIDRFFIEHKDWLIARSISLSQDPLFCPHISLLNNKFTSTASKRLVKIIKTVGSNPLIRLTQCTAKQDRIKAVADECVCLLTRAMNRAFEEWKKETKQIPGTMAELVDVRSPFLTKQSILNKELIPFIRQMFCKSSPIFRTSCVDISTSAENIAVELLRGFLDELIQQGAIYNYDLCEYIDDEDILWLRF